MMLYRTSLVVLLALAVYAVPAPDTKTKSGEAPTGPSSPPASTGPITAEGGSAEDNNTEPVKTGGFSCEGRIFGYYGDPANCSLFHYCEPFVDPENNQFVLHAAYLCPNETVFNQLSLTCSYPGEALPCDRAPEYYYINSHVVPADAASSTEVPSSSEAAEAVTTVAPEPEEKPAKQK